MRTNSFRYMILGKTVELLAILAQATHGGKRFCLLHDVTPWGCANIEYIHIFNYLIPVYAVATVFAHMGARAAVVLATTASNICSHDSWSNAIYIKSYWIIETFFKAQKIERTLLRLMWKICTLKHTDTNLIHVEREKERRKEANKRDTLDIRW